jgi:hypothetical protein
MATQPKPRILRRGQKYEVGEEVIFPDDEQPWLVFNAYRGATVLIDSQVRDSRLASFPNQRTITRRVYDCGKARAAVQPTLIDAELVLEQDDDFQRYNTFIQQHGGTA